MMRRLFLLQTKAALMTARVVQFDPDRPIGVRVRRSHNVSLRLKCLSLFLLFSFLSFHQALSSNTSPFSTTVIMSPFFFLTLATLIASIQAFSITFPTSSDYWVSCKWNTLKWTFDTNDPEIFSVAIMHSNMSLLNGNCQIANSLSTSNGTANLTTNCLEATDGYYLLFVNSSQ